MESGIKRKLTEVEISAIAELTFGQKITANVELTDGCANSAYSVTLQDGRNVIIKVAPPSNTKMMTYEQHIMAAEVEVMRLVKQTGSIPVPQIYAYDQTKSIVNCEYFVMEKLEGEPYNKVKKSLTDEQRSGIEHQLGIYNRRINEIRGESFGCFAHTDEPGTPWKTTFHRMLLDVLADGERENVRLPASYETIRQEISLRLDALDEVIEPRLVHWDLWDGNIFVKDAAITGLIDFERALWGDPLLEIYFGHFNQSQSFFDGYGLSELTPSQRARIALYDLYLDLILSIECAYRFYSDINHINWTRDNLVQGWNRFMSRSN
ncbi:aminoglycoside phosphotransferase (APT) family kinase protein [Paenibacillus castaneae]|uniref:phosphotransferase family protein n=1 Tax=Paenibacillus castaneae TaxID=474957 RepID=UPI000C9B91D3|nr:aminoglycoside phosphotransferase family protein [Paenibacillus castaneae]NIK79662.1 aminoglycoside phosphotransferase (APT) family kinase protein [Paenibacillus castaneae]